MSIIIAIVEKYYHHHSSWPLIMTVPRTSYHPTLHCGLSAKCDNAHMISQEYIVSVYIIWIVCRYVTS